ncbi:MAG: class I SAM-dependent methyltransferase [Spirochaetales bacterium]|nr:class I SAM-dependent methyltransferase [Spirochaetales bacterium]
MNKTVDWNELWGINLLNASWRRNRENPVALWDKRAIAYNRMIASRTAQTEQIMNKLEIRADDCVLDIGSGPGTLTIPLAEIAAEVTAVDPSSKMIDCIKEKVKKAGYENISYVNRTWEDAISGIDFDNIDVVVACHCLIMPDMKEALRKMNAAAGRRVYLFRFAGITGGAFEKLWPELYDEKFRPNPDYIYIVNILHQMGIYADIEILEQRTTRIFSSCDEAVDDLLESFVDPPENARQIIYRYMKKTLESKNGALCLEQDFKVAMISWHK